MAKIKKEEKEVSGDKPKLSGKIYCKICNAGFTTTGSDTCPKCEGKQ